jgi:N-acetylglucosaminyldiphosphoundecaprenol N-acetyl-beta-D-mannosaminyltransferase
MKERIMGYDVETSTPRILADELFTEIIQSSSVRRHCSWLACLNPHSYVVAKSDSRFAQALSDADWLIPDGAGIVLASKMLGGCIRERVTGSDVFADLHSRMNSTGNMSVFFLGSTEETLNSIIDKMKKDYPNIRLAGSYSPPFKVQYSSAELEEMIGAINAAKPDVLWVGLTAPKQEKWIFANRTKLDVRFAAAVGAVFDFYSGRVKRSHPIFQKPGLEWLPRLLQEPRRLWRRMFVSAPIFMLDVAGALVAKAINRG